MSDFNVLFSLWAFIILMVGTPGPANLLAMSAGSQFGFYKCLPFNFGLTLGKILLNIAMGLGLGVLLVFARVSYGFITANINICHGQF